MENDSIGWHDPQSEIICVLNFDLQYYLIKVFSYLHILNLQHFLKIGLFLLSLEMNEGLVFDTFKGSRGRAGYVYTGDNGDDKCTIEVPADTTGVRMVVTVLLHGCNKKCQLFEIRRCFGFGKVTHMCEFCSLFFLFIYFFRIPPSQFLSLWHVIFYVCIKKF